MKSKLILLNRFVTIIFPVFAAAVNGSLIWLAWKNFGISSDLPEFYCAARLAISHCGSQIYDLVTFGKVENLMFPSLAGRSIGFMLPPLGIPWLLPLGCLPVHAVAIVWKSLNVSAVILAIVLLKKIFSLALKECLWLITGLGFSGPLFEALRIDQLAPFLLLAFCLALWAIQSDRPLLAGAILAVFWLKPQQILAFLIALLACGRFASLSYWLGFSVLLALASVLLLGVDGVAKYAMIFSPMAAPYMQSELSATFRGQLLRMFPQSGHMVMLGSIVLLLAALALIFNLTRQFRKSSNWLEVCTLVAMPLGLLSSLHCFSYDLILLTPALVVYFKYRDRLSRASWLFAGIFAFCFCFVLPIYLKIHYDYLLKGGVINPFFIALLLFAISVLSLVNTNAERLKA